MGYDVFDQPDDMERLIQAIEALTEALHQLGTNHAATDQGAIELLVGAIERATGND
jgi:hypothetical protein